VSHVPVANGLVAEFRCIGRGDQGGLASAPIAESEGDK
jgi:hypothetical protein